MKIEHFYYFKAVVECKSISLAAEKLYLSQQRLSDIISQMEETLNISLLHRSNKGVALTEAGEKALVKMEMLLSVYEDLLQTGIPQDALMMDLRMSNDKFINTCYCGDIMTIFNDYFPRIHLHIEEEMSPFAIIEKIINQELDLGITTCSEDFIKHDPMIEQYKDKAFIMRFLHTDSLYMVGHQSLNILQKPFLSVGDLFAFPLIVNKDSFLLRYLQTVYSNRKPDVFLASNSAIAQLSALQEKKGVSFTAGFALENMPLSECQLLARPLEETKLKIVAFIPVGKADDKTINHFLKLLQKTIQIHRVKKSLVIS